MEFIKHKLANSDDNTLAPCLPSSTVDVITFKWECNFITMLSPRQSHEDVAFP